jgi:hypothetical protein
MKKILEKERKRGRKKYVKKKKRIPLKLDFFRGISIPILCDLPLSWPERRGIHSSEHRISIQLLCIRFNSMILSEEFKKEVNVTHMKFSFLPKEFGGLGVRNL